MTNSVPRWSLSATLPEGSLATIQQVRKRLLAAIRPHPTKTRKRNFQIASTRAWGRLARPIWDRRALGFAEHVPIAHQRPASAAIRALWVDAARHAQGVELLLALRRLQSGRT